MMDNQKCISIISKETEWTDFDISSILHSYQKNYHQLRSMNYIAKGMEDKECKKRF